MNLPASAIARACTRALTEIEAERARLLAARARTANGLPVGPQIAGHTELTAALSRLDRRRRPIERLHDRTRLRPAGPLVLTAAELALVHAHYPLETVR